MELKPSTRKGKRYMAVFPDGTITHFGSATMENYTIHGDEARKKAYLRRHKKNEDWTDPKSAGTLAKYILSIYYRFIKSMAKIDNISCY